MEKTAAVQLMDEVRNQRTLDIDQNLHDPGFDDRGGKMLRLQARLRRIEMTEEEARVIIAELEKWVAWCRSCVPCRSSMPYTIKFLKKRFNIE